MECPNCRTTITVHRNPTPTVDIIIEIEGRIVLIKRKNPPFGWALPGGFVDYGESFEAAAVREMAEETGLNVTLTGLLGVYSDPARDPRGHTVGIVYTGQAHGSPTALDDAAAVGVVCHEHLPALAFDHAAILEDYRRARAARRDF